MTSTDKDRPARVSQPRQDAGAGGNIKPHTHTCYCCRYTWECLDGKRCKIEEAAKVNGTGPYCNLCFHLEFAHRHAEMRGRVVATDLIRQVQILLGKNRPTSLNSPRQQ